MPARKKKVTLKALKNELKKFDSEDLVKTITKTLTSPTSQILHLMQCDDKTNKTRIIDMAIARAVYLSYTEGDIKRLAWLLEKIGIKEIEKMSKNDADLSKVNNETLLKALNGGLKK